MNPDVNEVKELVRQAIAIGEENNVLLKKMRRSARLGSFLHILYWLIIIGLSIGAFYFVQPYITALESVWDKSGLMSGSSQQSQNGSTSASSSSFESFFKNL